jgi:DNA-binding GntR family transcriptional regulator
MTKLPSAKIRDSLEQRIIEGELGIGKRLDEAELSKHYGVSRTPVREALQRLAESGLAEHLPRRGTFVSTPSLSELVEMFEVMAELECMAVRLATRRATSADIDALTESNETCRAAFEAGDTKRYYELNAAVHRQIYKMSGNSFLTVEARRLHDRLRPYRRLQLRVRGRMGESMNEHDIILAAMRDGDCQQAVVTMRKHITILGERFNDLVSGFNLLMANHGKD